MSPIEDAHRQALLRRLVERTGESERAVALVLDAADGQIADAEECLAELAGWLDGDDEEDTRRFVRYWIESNRALPTTAAWQRGRRDALAAVAAGTFCELTSGLLGGDVRTATCPACMLRRDYPVDDWRRFVLPPCEGCGGALVPLRSTGCEVEKDTDGYVRGYNDAVAEHLRQHNPAFRWRDVRDGG